MPDPILAVEEIDVTRGGAQVLSGVSLEATAGSLLALVGPNGSGKTTLLETIQGLLPPIRGAIWFQGERVDGLPAHERVGRGIVSVPEQRRIFPEMSVRENLEIGAYVPRARPALAEGLGFVYDLFPALRERERRQAGTLSAGEQQMLAIGRGLMSRPRVLLLDDPFLGLAPRIVGALCGVVRRLVADGVAMIIAAQHVRRVLSLADRGILLEEGRVALAGPAGHLLASEHLQRALLPR